jgi:hypothetical protein
MFRAIVDSTAQEITIAPRSRSRSRFSCGERLMRWAELLGRYQDGDIQLLTDTECLRVSERAALRLNNSPIAVAYADPQLRANGLGGDSYGDAYKFFGLSHETLHDIVCYCHYRSSRISPKEVAGRVRRVANRARWVDAMLGAVGLQATRVGAWLTIALV